MSTSRIRRVVEADLLSMPRPIMDREVEAIGMDRMVDLWLVFDLSAALRTVSMVRYRNRVGESARRREALQETREAVWQARGALAELANALQLLLVLEREG